MESNKCYKCFHSQVWARKEHADHVKKFCYKLWDDVDPDDHCGYYITWLAPTLYGVRVKGVSAEPDGLYEKVV
jgi:hypothetical protein